MMSLPTLNGIYMLQNERPLEVESEARPFLEIICVTYFRLNPLRCLVASLACQTNLQFLIKIIHDGPSLETRECVMDLKRIYPNLNIVYQETEYRYDDYGHTLRSIGLMDSQQEYVLLTNDDNYYAPVFIEEIHEVLERERADIVFCDMVHNYALAHHAEPMPYQTLITEPFIERIDIGCFVFRTELGKSTGFNDRTYLADGIFFEAMKAAGASIVKIPKVLFVHN